MTTTTKKLGREIRLTPSQAYLYNAYMALSGSGDINALAVLLERPSTLKSAISAAFYKSAGVNLSDCI